LRIPNIVQGFPEFDENVRQGCGNADRRATACTPEHAEFASGGNDGVIPMITQRPGTGNSSLPRLARIVHVRDVLHKIEDWAHGFIGCKAAPGIIRSR
jgi:hypothetical protein